jgi:hypothetical protein
MKEGCSFTASEVLSEATIQLDDNPNDEMIM